MKNNPKLAGQQAGESQFFNLSRWKVAPVHTRFESVEWFIWDSNVIDDITGQPAVIGQFSSEAEAVRRACN